MPVTPDLPAPPALLPDPMDLSEAQIRGADCVWCAETLTPETAVDLGEKVAEAYGIAAHWFPRACRDCVGPQTYRALLDHAQTCEQCADDQSRCETGKALREAVREARR